MKNKLSTLLAAAVVGLGMVTVSGSAEARCHHHKGSCYTSCCHRHCYHKVVRCETVPSFWMYGYHYPAREVCWVKDHGVWYRSTYKWVHCNSVDGYCGSRYCGGGYCNSGYCNSMNHGRGGYYNVLR